MLAIIWVVVVVAATIRRQNAISRLAAQLVPADPRLECLAQYGICYVYEPDWYAEVWAATRVVRSEEARLCVPPHFPVFGNLPAPNDYVW